MKVTLHSQKGTKLKKTVDVNDALVAGDINPDLLAQYVYVYLSNQREAIAHTKDRSAVSGGGAKPWRQKGTGRARHGSNRSPIWVGGGVTFGPSNQRNWKRNMPKKMKRAAMRSALASMQAKEDIVFIDKIDIKDEKKTAQAVEFKNTFDNPKKFTIVLGENNDAVRAAFNNVPGAKVINIKEMNPYEVLNAGKLFILEDAVAFMEVWAA